MNFLRAFVELLLSFVHFLRAGNGGHGIVDPDPFVNYQIDVPGRDYGAPFYKTLLLQHEFAASWGHPFSVRYTPPNQEFSHVELTLEVSSFGVQYDRLAHVYFDGIEIWRPSTSEPRGRRSYSTFTKDLSAYAALFSRRGEISVELNNLVTERLNGTFNVSLSATYYNVANVPGPREWFEHDGKPATGIQQVLNNRVATGPAAAKIPQLRRNSTGAVLQVFASGNGNDEFWYAEGLDGDDNDNLGALRRIEVRIGDDIAGVITPFYQIYTGGIQPALWSPLVGVSTYDAPSYYIDVTPFLPDLWDSDCKVRVRVVNQDGQTVRNEWILSAALLTWETTDVVGSGKRHATVVTDKTHKISAPGAEIVNFVHRVNASADLKLSGRTERVEWYQDQAVNIVNAGALSISHHTEGSSSLTLGKQVYSRSHDYSLHIGLDEQEVGLAQGYLTSDTNQADPEVSADFWRRSLSYEGAWSNSTHHGKKQRGIRYASDVHVAFEQTGQAPRPKLSIHAKSCNGSLKYIHENTHDDDQCFEDEDSLSTTTPPAVDQARAHAIRRKWMRHILL